MCVGGGVCVGVCVVEVWGVCVGGEVCVCVCGEGVCMRGMHTPVVVGSQEPCGLLWNRVCLLTQDAGLVLGSGAEGVGVGWQEGQEGEQQAGLSTKEA